MTSANADDRKRTLLNVSITKDDKALDVEPPIASLLKSRMIGGGPVNAAVMRASLLKRQETHVRPLAEAC